MLRVGAVMWGYSRFPGWLGACFALTHTVMQAIVVSSSMPAGHANQQQLGRRQTNSKRLACQVRKQQARMPQHADQQPLAAADPCRTPSIKRLACQVRQAGHPQRPLSDQLAVAVGLVVLAGDEKRALHVEQ